MPLVFLLLWFSPMLFAADVPYVNWENHPVHALDISPDKTRLAVAHTADNRVQLFDVSQGYPVRLGHVNVGIDPVSVRFKDNNELWVVNHISDSVSVVDFNQRMVKLTLQTEDEPFDVVFANNQAFVSCSQVNKVMVFNTLALSAEPTVIALMAEEPRAMTVNADGSQVYVASFESGNKTTILAGGIDETENTLTFPFNPVNRTTSPYQGENPPPNEGDQFFPAINPDLPTAPKVSLIVKQASDGRWLDDNDRDWTEFISGSQAASSGRIEGWELLDHDIAVIDTQTHEVSYVSGLMNIGMAIGFNQASNEVTLVGTDATNEVRFEPVLNGKFLQVKMGKVTTNDLQQTEVIDLNPHLDYVAETEPQSIRDQSIGDPRGVVWNQAGDRGYVAGMGSDNVVVINQSGDRLAQIAVGEGATGLALDDDKARLYVWNHFAASLSVVDVSNNTEISQMTVFNPLPEAIKQGRPFLYNTQETSGLGQIACASCHVDGRMDRLAWDLGDPAGEMKIFNQNCQTTVSLLNTPGCSDFHPMKGPMMTQTFQDIIGNEPFHWRGDRDGLEEFNGAFMSLNGDDQRLNPEQMQQFKLMLATITFPPNPFRNIDNSLPESIDLSNHYTSGRFAPAGSPLGSGNPQNGLSLYNSRVLDTVFQCASCHSLPTGMAVNGPLRPALINLDVGGQIMPTGPMGENHLGIVSVDGSTQKSIKTPQLRNLYEKVGFETSRSQSLAGFGFLHDGAIDSVSRFLSAGAFSVRSDQEVADLVALMMAFSGSELDPGFVPLGNTPPESQDTHAGVGKQYTLQQASQINAGVEQLIQVADTGKVELIARLGSSSSYLYDADNGEFLSSKQQVISSLGLMSLAANEQPLTFSLVPLGLGERLAFDRDGDGIYDEQEIINGSDLTDQNSTEIKPRAGLWYNPDRNGHGFDLQRAGDNIFIIWYTYNDDGSPTWYIASGVYTPNWQANLIRVTWDANSRTPTSEDVGIATLDFTDAKHANFSWEINGRASAEPFQYLDFAAGNTINQQTGSYYDPNDSGWGVSVITQGPVAVAIMFYYDENGQPIWALGTGANLANTRIDMSANTGFCPDCDFAPTNDQVFVGTIELNYSSSRNIDFDVNLQYPLNSINWNLNGVNLTPLSNELFDPKIQ
ncbi:YVTN family beta-propeller protein [Marinicella litoralis]|uniref:YVTN family beta-propeller protein n=2 Tax=Marinicella litoralis TaxID=644220 RepID=A0A4R6XJ41_9GAMM|nr:YVTN family beta-propeller protein [Marinicella litoralis]